MILDLAGSNYGALTEVYTGKYLNELVSVGSNAFGNPDDGTGRLRFAVKAGTSYQIAVDTYSSGTVGPIKLRLRFASPAFTPEITQQPQGQSLEERTDTATFTVAAVSGTPVRYQWRFNGAALAKATNTTLTLPNVRADQAGGYDVVVSNGGGSVTSAAATLTVLGRPANDDFADRIKLSGAAVSTTGTTLRASREDTAGEPTAGNGYYRSVWWTWTAPASQPVVLDLAGSSYYTAADIYTGSALAELTVVAVNHQFNPADQTSKVRFVAAAGTTYQLKIATGNPGYQGDVKLSLDQPPATSTCWHCSGL